MFPHNFPIDGKLPNCYRLAADFLATQTSLKQVAVMEFGKRHDTTDFCSHQLVTDLLRGNWCNGFWR